MAKTLMLTFQSSNKLQTLLWFVKTRPQARQYIFVLNDEFLFQAKKRRKISCPNKFTTGR